MKRRTSAAVTRITFNSTSNMNNRFSTIDGYFLQDDESTKAKTFNFKIQNFGLKPFKRSEKDKRKTSWQRLEAKVDELNATSKGLAKYKLLFIGRHSEAKQQKDGFSDEADEENWQDPSLTQTGARQAKEANMFWLYQLLREDMSLPQRFYSGPQKKCLETAQITYSNLAEDESPLVVTVKDTLRTKADGLIERRRPKTEIQTGHPTFNFEEDFTETDQLWETIAPDSDDHADQRMESFLEKLFDEDESSFISLTVDAGAVAAFLRVLGHRDFDLPPAHIIPVLVKQLVK
ncbi:phosphoglycerate mutase [Phlyctema vagabunda]|uniref:Phosphoglycerate mutase n=1 Tax=Phlyctema vagabunda TaxID=108571 RepID=A0ABR4PAC3_9HELO